ncbi:MULTISPECIES: hypothetical protein [unclassified Streptomyces]|uniref:hypothetical protein n=1 Tax=Streptomyces sp. NPDC127532 TaxID=3345399 RepID=UPI00362AB3FB
MKCHHSGGVHDFAIETDSMARCPEHGITLLWHGEPITNTELAEAAAAEARLDDMLALAEQLRGDTHSTPCRAARQPHLADAHDHCRLRDCACVCHIRNGTARPVGTPICRP